MLFHAGPNVMVWDVVTDEMSEHVHRWPIGYGWEVRVLTPRFGIDSEAIGGWSLTRRAALRRVREAEQDLGLS